MLALRGRLRVVERWVWCLVRLNVRAVWGLQRSNVLGELTAVTDELVSEINTTHITATSVCALLGKIAARGGQCR